MVCGPFKVKRSVFNFHCFIVPPFKTMDADAILGESIEDVEERCYNDWRLWYGPTYQEQNLEWVRPLIVAQDGIVRSCSRDGSMLKVYSPWAKFTYYYKLSGGNYTEEEVKQLKELT